jgi:hypothetical protein
MRSASDVVWGSPHTMFEQSEAEMAQRNGLDERELCIETLPSRRRDPFIKARSAQRHGNAVPLKLGEGAEGGF